MHNFYFNIDRIYPKYFSIIFSLFSNYFGKNNLVYSKKLLPFNIKSISPIQKYIFTDYIKSIYLQIILKVYIYIVAEEYPRRSMISIKVKSNVFAWMFSCKLTKYLQNIFLEKYLWVTVSVYMEVNKIDASRHSPVQN